MKGEWKKNFKSTKSAKILSVFLVLSLLYGTIAFAGDQPPAEEIDPSSAVVATQQIDEPKGEETSTTDANNSKEEGENPTEEDLPDNEDDTTTNPENPDQEEPPITNEKTLDEIVAEDIKDTSKLDFNISTKGEKDNKKAGEVIDINIALDLNLVRNHSFADDEGTTEIYQGIENDPRIIIQLGDHLEVNKDDLKELEENDDIKSVEINDNEITIKLDLQTSKGYKSRITFPAKIKGNGILEPSAIDIAGNFIADVVYLNDDKQETAMPIDVASHYEINTVADEFWFVNAEAPQINYDAKDGYTLLTYSLVTGLNNDTVDYDNPPKTGLVAPEESRYSANGRLLFLEDSYKLSLPTINLVADDENKSKIEPEEIVLKREFSQDITNSVDNTGFVVSDYDTKEIPEVADGKVSPYYSKYKLEVWVKNQDRMVDFNSKITSFQVEDSVVTLDFQLPQLGEFQTEVALKGSIPSIPEKSATLIIDTKVTEFDYSNGGYKTSVNYTNKHKDIGFNNDDFGYKLYLDPEGTVEAENNQGLPIKPEIGTDVNLPGRYTFFGLDPSVDYYIKIDGKLGESQLGSFELAEEITKDSIYKISKENLAQDEDTHATFTFEQKNYGAVQINKQVKYMLDGGQFELRPIDGKGIGFTLTNKTSGKEYTLIADKTDDTNPENEFSYGTLENIPVGEYSVEEIADPRYQPISIADITITEGEYTVVGKDAPLVNEQNYGGGTIEFDFSEYEFQFLFPSELEEEEPVPPPAPMKRSGFASRNMMMRSFMPQMAARADSGITSGDPSATLVGKPKKELEFKVYRLIGDENDKNAELVTQVDQSGESVPLILKTKDQKVDIALPQGEYFLELIKIGEEDPKQLVSGTETITVDGKPVQAISRFSVTTGKFNEIKPENLGVVGSFPKTAPFMFKKTDVIGKGLSPESTEAVWDIYKVDWQGKELESEITRGEKLYSGLGTDETDKDALDYLNPPPSENQGFYGYKMLEPGWYELVEVSNSDDYDPPLKNGSYVFEIKELKIEGKNIEEIKKNINEKQKTQMYFLDTRNKEKIESSRVQSIPNVTYDEGGIFKVTQFFDDSYREDDTIDSKGARFLVYQLLPKNGIDPAEFYNKYSDFKNYDTKPSKVKPEDILRDGYLVPYESDLFYADGEKHHVEVASIDDSGTLKFDGANENILPALRNKKAVFEQGIYFFLETQAPAGLLLPNESSFPTPNFGPAFSGQETRAAAVQGYLHYTIGDETEILFGPIVMRDKEVPLEPESEETTTEMKLDFSFFIPNGTNRSYLKVKVNPTYVSTDALGGGTFATYHLDNQSKKVSISGHFRNYDKENTPPLFFTDYTTNKDVPVGSVGKYTFKNHEPVTVEKNGEDVLYDYTEAFPYMPKVADTLVENGNQYLYVEQLKAPSGYAINPYDNIKQVLLEESDQGYLKVKSKDGSKQSVQDVTFENAPVFNLEVKNISTSPKQEPITDVQYQLYKKLKDSSTWQKAGSWQTKANDGLVKFSGLSPYYEYAIVQQENPAYTLQTLIKGESEIELAYTDAEKSTITVDGKAISNAYVFSIDYKQLTKPEQTAVFVASNKHSGELNIYVGDVDAGESLAGKPTRPLSGGKVKVYEITKELAKKKGITENMTYTELEKALQGVELGSADAPLLKNGIKEEPDVPNGGVNYQGLRDDTLYLVVQTKPANGYVINTKYSAKGNLSVEPKKVVRSVLNQDESKKTNTVSLYNAEESMLKHNQKPNIEISITSPKNQVNSVPALEGSLTEKSNNISATIKGFATKNNKLEYDELGVENVKLQFYYDYDFNQKVTMTDDDYSFTKITAFVNSKDYTEAPILKYRTHLGGEQRNLTGTLEQQGKYVFDLSSINGNVVEFDVIYPNAPVGFVSNGIEADAEIFQRAKSKDKEVVGINLTGTAVGKYQLSDLPPQSDTIKVEYKGKNNRVIVELFEEHPTIKSSLRVNKVNDSNAGNMPTATFKDEIEYLAQVKNTHKEYTFKEPVLAFEIPHNATALNGYNNGKINLTVLDGSGTITQSHDLKVKNNGIIEKHIDGKSYLVVLFSGSLPQGYSVEVKFASQMPTTASGKTEDNKAVMYVTDNNNAIITAENPLGVGFKLNTNSYPKAKYPALDKLLTSPEMPEFTKDVFGADTVTASYNTKIRAGQHYMLFVKGNYDDKLGNGYIDAQDNAQTRANVGSDGLIDYKFSLLNASQSDSIDNLKIVATIPEVGDSSILSSNDSRGNKTWGPTLTNNNGSFYSLDYIDISPEGNQSSINIKPKTYVITADKVAGMTMAERNTFITNTSKNILSKTGSYAEPWTEYTNQSLEDVIAVSFDFGAQKLPKNWRLDLHVYMRAPKLSNLEETKFAGKQMAASFAYYAPFSSDNTTNATETVLAKTNFNRKTVGVGGRAWLDTSSSGLRGANDPLIEGVKVKLHTYRYSFDGKKKEVLDQKITTTDKNGRFEFLELMPSVMAENQEDQNQYYKYRLEVEKPKDLEPTRRFAGYKEDSIDVGNVLHPDNSKYNPPYTYDKDNEYISHKRDIDNNFGYNEENSLVSEEFYLNPIPDLDTLEIPSTEVDKDQRENGIDMSYDVGLVVNRKLAVINLDSGKYGTAKDTVLDGGEFRLKTADGTLADINLPANAFIDYTLEQTKVTKGYFENKKKEEILIKGITPKDLTTTNSDDKFKVVTLKELEKLDKVHETVVYDDLHVARVGIKVIDAFSGEPIVVPQGKQGFSFKVYTVDEQGVKHPYEKQQNGKPIGEYSFNLKENGTFETIPLPLGKYYFEQTQLPPEYIDQAGGFYLDLNLDTQGELDKLRVNNNDLVNIVLEYEGETTLKIQVLDSKTNKNLNGEFEVYREKIDPKNPDKPITFEDAKKNGIYATVDINGKIPHEGLTSGNGFKYFVKQTKAESSYTASNKILEAEFKTIGKEIMLTFYNTKKTSPGGGNPDRPDHKDVIDRPNIPVKKGLIGGGLNMVTQLPLTGGETAVATSIFTLIATLFTLLIIKIIRLFN